MSELAEAAEVAEFALFPKLPLELRQKIWKAAVPAFEVGEFLEIEVGETWERNCTKFPTASCAKQVNREGSGYLNRIEFYIEYSFDKSLLETSSEPRRYILRSLPASVASVEPLEVIRFNPKKTTIYIKSVRSTTPSSEKIERIATDAWLFDDTYYAFNFDEEHETWCLLFKNMFPDMKVVVVALDSEKDKDGRDIKEYVLKWWKRLEADKGLRVHMGSRAFPELKFHKGKLGSEDCRMVGTCFPSWALHKLFTNGASTVVLCDSSLLLNVLLRSKDTMYFPGCWRSHFLVHTFLCAIIRATPTAGPSINITVSVPAGTSDHGDPNLLSTVKTLPEESTTDLAFAVFLAIAFQFSGVARGFEAIARHASFSWRRKTFSCDDLRTAARAGALCIVVRNEYWDGLGLSIEGVKPNLDRSKYQLEYVIPTYRKVHGLSKLPEDYQEDLTLSSSTSIPQSMVAIFQVLYVSYTLYKTRGDQLNRDGYAAFGLTVTPYIIMSFLNLLGNISTPDYPTLYLVGSAELEEAKLREDVAIDGVVGSVVLVTWDVECKESFTGLVRWPLSHRDERYKTFFAECSPFKIVDGEHPFRGHKPLRRSSYLWWGFMVLLGTISYAVIGALTQFQAAQSTQAQRVFTMFWLASGVFIRATIPLISFSFHEVVDIIKGAFSQKARENAINARETAAVAKENAKKAMEKAEAVMERAMTAKDNADVAREAAKGAQKVIEDAEEGQPGVDTQGGSTEFTTWRIGRLS
ncbi:hypothetical protein L207DRAFT_627919 [Hyaloscypha variabilis F]|uniref:2EXR domain-containing protein n=1 Tax=Hyaloscypha variabilis (strain UAMH 11265 / GT02V1 / F) TaxID=1149755 RepID=A0A2J6S904_HYAVF|nr:hypothetical protein L207DRAFT_627919 [Hyaloscypha variabilis F]